MMLGWLRNSCSKVRVVQRSSKVSATSKTKKEAIFNVAMLEMLSTWRKQSNVEMKLYDWTFYHEPCLFDGVLDLMFLKTFQAAVAWVEYVSIKREHGITEVAFT
jgi:hypothetical protein